MVVEIVERYLLYLLAHSSREEKCISIRWYILEDGVDALGETHIEHLVSLIQYNIVHMLQLSHATIDEVEKTTRCGYDDLYTMLEGAYLTAYIGSAIDCSNVESVDVLGETVEVIGYLETKLTGRTQDNGLCLLVLSIGLLNDRNTIGCSLTSSCLRQRDDIVFVA